MPCTHAAPTCGDVVGSAADGVALTVWGLHDRCQPKVCQLDLPLSRQQDIGQLQRPVPGVSQAVLLCTSCSACGRKEHQTAKSQVLAPCPVSNASVSHTGQQAPQLQRFDEGVCAPRRAGEAVLATAWFLLETSP